MLLCVDCKQVKHLDNFYLTGRTSKGTATYFSYCRPCKSLREKKKRLGEDVPDNRRVSKEAATEIYCPACGETKDRTAYSFRSSGRQAGQPYLPCRECANARHREYLKNNPEVRKRHRKPAHSTNHYLRKYGLDVDAFNALMQEQGGGCAICGVAISGRGTQSPAIDHDHRTGQVRGLLCKPHNAALGLFGDSPDLLDRAADYLRRTRV